MADVQGQSGRDPTKEIMSDLQSNAADIAQEAIEFWFEQSQEWVREAAENRANIDSEGRIGRERNGLYAIQQMAQPPTWNDSEGHWSFSYPHEGAIFQEFGARPHEIRAKKAEVLAFEWPDAPREVQEQFEDTEGDLVFFESIDHPGIPAIGFVRKGRDRTKARLESLGIDTEESGGRR